MWAMVRALRARGVTIILTTHYIEEAEEMADRIGVIERGELILVEEKAALMRQARQEAADPAPAAAARGPARRPWRPTASSLADGGRELVYTFDARRGATGIAELMRRLGAAGIDFKDLPTRESSLEDIFVRLVSGGGHERLTASGAIYRFELSRWFRTLTQSLLSPVISTSLYFVVFGSAIGSRMHAIDGVSYAAFIVPGLTMLSILTESVGNGSFGIHMPKWSGTIYELLSAPVSWYEAVVGYVGAAATKSIAARAWSSFSPRACSCPITSPTRCGWPAFLVLTAVSFSLFGFIIGVWAEGWERLQIVPALIITPLTFLGGSFYSIAMLPPLWRKVTLFNPVVYLVSGFRWSFYGVSDVGVALSLAMTLGFLALVPGRRLADLQDRLQAEGVRARAGRRGPQAEVFFSA